MSCFCAAFVASPCATRRRRASTTRLPNRASDARDGGAPEAAAQSRIHAQIQLVCNTVCLNRWGRTMDDSVPSGSPPKRLASSSSAI
eukprot:3840173-Prymnesium_polylepis.1